MIGAYVMRQSDCQRDTAKPDSVAMGTFILDSHCVQRLVTPDGLAIDEGNFDVPVRPYQIAYRSITPRRGAMRKPARASLPVGQPRGLRVDSDGAAVHDAGPCRRAGGGDGH